MPMLSEDVPDFSHPYKVNLKKISDLSEFLHKAAQSQHFWLYDPTYIFARTRLVHTRQVTSLTMPQLKLGNIRVIFPNFRVVMSIHCPSLARNHAQIFVLGHRSNLYWKRIIRRQIYIRRRFIHLKRFGLPGRITRLCVNPVFRRIIWPNIVFS